MKITVLKTSENLVWVSMNEIIPWIERLWLKFGKSRGYEVSVVSIDGKEPSELFPELFTSDLVVVTSFTTPMARLLYLAKGRLGMPLRIIFYLHNQATIGCWPLYEWKLGEVLDTADKFIGSCSRDKDSMDACFENASTIIHPFSLDEYSLTVSPPPANELAHFVFIGRVSPQKNLHTAIWAFHLLKVDFPELKWKLEIFGGEDHYGSPLMGIGCDTYRDYLEKLIDKLGLKSEIAFRGFMDRELIQKEMETHRRIFLAPSLHSDENFGMAAFRSLSQGHKAVLSDWGGHGDYRHYFPENLFLVPVREGSLGPFIDVSDLTSALKAAADEQRVHSRNSQYYDPENIFKVLDQLTVKPDFAPVKLRRTSLGKRIHEKREIFYQEEQAEKSGTDEPIRGCRIFSDFRDEDAKSMFRAYGMKSAPKDHSAPLIRAPWIIRGEDHLIIDDPMKGTIQVKLPTKLSENQWLLESGYATPIED